MSICVKKFVRSVTFPLGEMVCPKIGMSSTCALFSAWGTRVTSCVDAKADNNVFVVPNNRLFMLPTHGVGHRTEIAHIGMPTGKPIVLETLSEYPRIFRVKNFFTEEEADQLIATALALEGDAFRLKRSSTGAKVCTLSIIIKVSRVRY